MVAGQRHAPPLYPRERAGIHCIGGWMGPRASLDGTGKSRPPTGIRSPDLPARTKSLYRLSFSGPPKAYRLIIVRCLRSLVFTNFPSSCPCFPLSVSFRIRSLRCATNSYTEFHDNQTYGLIADSRSLTDGRTEVTGIPRRRSFFTGQRRLVGRNR
jgi:hypothetical protein